MRLIMYRTVQSGWIRLPYYYLLGIGLLSATQPPHQHEHHADILQSCARTSMALLMTSGGSWP